MYPVLLDSVKLSSEGCFANLSILAILLDPELRREHDTLMLHLSLEIFKPECRLEHLYLELVFSVSKLCYQFQISLLCEPPPSVLPHYSLRSFFPQSLDTLQYRLYQSCVLYSSTSVNTHWRCWICSYGKILVCAMDTLLQLYSLN